MSGHLKIMLKVDDWRKGPQYIQIYENNSTEAAAEQTEGARALTGTANRINDLSLILHTAPPHRHKSNYYEMAFKILRDLAVKQDASIISE